MKQLAGQVVIITGASAGIGAAAARMLSEHGASIVLAARRLDRVEAIKHELELAGGKALAVACDVTSAEDRHELVASTLREFGQIDALVNNAGYGQRGPIEIVPIEAIRENFETNLFSLIALTQLVIPVMRRQKSGRIINISSVAGRIARPLSSIYDSTKHALEAISDGLRGELAPFGIQVVVIEPGYILTEFIGVANEFSKEIIEAETPYAPFLEGLSEAHKRVRGIAGKPDDIARLIVRALTAEHPKNRYAGPMHARVFLALKRLLPESLLDYIIRKQSGISREKLIAYQSRTARDGAAGD